MDWEFLSEENSNLVQHKPIFLIEKVINVFSYNIV